MKYTNLIYHWRNLCIFIHLCNHTDQNREHFPTPAGPLCALLVSNLQKDDPLVLTSHHGLVLLVFELHIMEFYSMCSLSPLPWCYVWDLSGISFNSLNMSEFLKTFRQINKDPLLRLNLILLIFSSFSSFLFFKPRLQKNTSLNKISHFTCFSMSESQEPCWIKKPDSSLGFASKYCHLGQVL